MRVLPVGAMTAPRFPFRKSYSFFIGMPLAPGRPACGNEANIVASVGVNDHEDLSHVIASNGDKSLLASGPLILLGDGVGIERNAFCVREAAAVLPKVLLALDGIP